MKNYSITGMSCAACSARVEKAVSSLPGVTSCTVNLLTASMKVEGSALPSEIISAVVDAGYGAALSEDFKLKSSEATETLRDKETPKIVKRLVISLATLVLLMYVSMGYTMLDMPLPKFMSENSTLLASIQAVLALFVMIVNRQFFINGAKGVVHRAPNMDTLVSLGSLASFGYSVYVLVLISIARNEGNYELASHGLHDLYFESAAMILALITLGKMLEARAKGKTTSAIEGLMRLAPKTATVIRDGREITLPIDEVCVGDLFAVRPGEQIPADGVVTSGHSAVNESMLTGESIPSEKEIGSRVYSGTLNESGYIVCEARSTASDSTLAEIIKTVSNASATKAPIAKLADKVSGVFVPCVLAISLATFVAWLIFDAELGFAFARAISVLVISCPCALGLATPVAVMVGMGIGAKRGILFKTAAALEEIARAKIVVLDKTGTVTEGNPTVVGVYPSEQSSESELLSVAYSVEKNSEHPLAKAVCSMGEEKGLSRLDVTEFKALAGNGVEGFIGDARFYGGNLKLVKEKAEVSEEMHLIGKNLSSEGKTPLFFALDNRLLGIIAVSDQVKKDSRDAVKALEREGRRVVMLTGDNELTANAVGREVGISEVVAGVLPGGKESAVRDLQRSGKVIMVGDGINDAPALTRADVGVAIGRGADIAIDSADVVLVNSRLSDVVDAIDLGKKTLRIIKQNLFWAFIYNVIGIPVAAGALYPILGLTLNPMIGALAMSFSSVTVVSNALRLNLIFNKTSKTKDKKEQKMKATLKIEGMMCPHCEARVKKCLEEIAGVTEAIVDHKSGTAVVMFDASVTAEALKSAVEAQGYPVTEIVQ